MNKAFDPQKVANAISYVLSQSGGSDFHKVFKILYFADQKHLVRYGKPIFNDTYHALKDGPVPTKTYDGLKSLKATNPFGIEDSPFKDFFTVSNDFYIVKLKEPDLDYLSETEMECLDESIEENKNLTFTVIREKSHGLAWKNGCEKLFPTIDFLDIAAEAKATPEMLAYINTYFENFRLLSE